MRPVIRSLLLAALLGVASPQGARFSSSGAQAVWAAEPTYRYAGRYEGNWSADIWLDALDPTSSSHVFEQRAGQMAGTLTLEVACDGTIVGQTYAQTRIPATFAALTDGEEGPRVLSAAVDVVVNGTLDGGLAAHSASGALGVETALDGNFRDLPTDLETASESLALHRWYAGAGTSRWSFAEGEPGRLAGNADASLALSVPDGRREPRLALSLSGRWVAVRTAIALCPWRATVVVRGAFGNEQLQEEQVDVVFRPTADGRLEGEGRGQAVVRGGPAGGCEYSGGGPFTVQVFGEARDGRFRLRLDDFEQPQLLVTTTCAGGRFVGPTPALSTQFSLIDLPETIGAQAHVDLPAGAGDARGTLDVTIEPVAGAAAP